MKKLKLAFRLTAVALLVASCGPKSSTSPEGALPAPTPPMKSNTCPQSSELEKASQEEGAVSYAKFKETLSGSFELREVHFAWESQIKDLGQSAAVTGRVLRALQPGENQVQMLIDCKAVEGNTVHVSFAQKVPILIHLPSERITVFDSGSNMDNPNFNFPRIAEFEVGLKQQENFSRYEETSDMIGKAPYTKNLFLSDVLQNIKGPGMHYIPHADQKGFDLLLSHQGDVIEGLEDSVNRKILLRYEQRED